MAPPPGCSLSSVQVSSGAPLPRSPQHLERVLTYLQLAGRVWSLRRREALVVLDTHVPLLLCPYHIGHCFGHCSPLPFKLLTLSLVEGHAQL